MTGEEKRSVASELGGPTGGTAATIGTAIAAAGAAALVPGLIVAGPVVIALAAAAAVGVTGGLVGALTNWGIPKGRVEQYEQAIRDGNILVGVEARSEEDARELQREWAAAGGKWWKPLKIVLKPDCFTGTASASTGSASSSSQPAPLTSRMSSHPSPS